MSKKRTQRSKASVPDKLREKLVDTYHAHRWQDAQSLASRLAKEYPKDAFAWKALGSVLLESGYPLESLEALDKALALNSEEVEAHNTKAQALYRLGRSVEAVDHLELSVKLQPSFRPARLLLIKLYNDAGGYEKSLEHIAEAERYFPDDDVLLSRKAHALTKLARFGEALVIHESIVARWPNDPVHLTNLASAYRNVGRFKEAEEKYLIALELAPKQDKTYSNYLMSMHYNPMHSAEALQAAHLEWDVRFRPKSRSPRPVPVSLSPGRRLRVGMISAGFRIHPVGQMITSVVESLSKVDFELFAYTVSEQNDALTQRMQKRVDSWQSVTHLSEVQLAEKIRHDNIDILIDLCGHTEGSRLLTVAHEPAPLQIKWVGGLINTTGLAAMDYLISDAVETPVGVDENYVEKLIRLPDDYICYMPRGNAPDVGVLPAIKNGFITFGCFNNPSKLNEELLGKWAEIMHFLPKSQLFLKGMQFDSQDFRERITDSLESLGIKRERIILEGHSDHYTLLGCYNRVDIAFDSWPYSGGLTTCEALFMGVPVVTYPGPSFAGRHSATHLTHAGLGELVADSWEQYKALTLELASNLESLAGLRRVLREKLQRSPVCDHHRFARHLTVALRAIWQRYCEGKPPAALTFNKEGKAWFEGESEPVTIQYAPEKEEGGFSWKLPGKIIVLDNSAKLVRQDGFDALRRLNAFGVVAFDPASRVENPGRFEGSDDVQVFPHAMLGDGQPATLYACLEPAFSATLKPLSADQLLGANAQRARVLTKLPINTVSLDSIEGLESLDWLILDDLSDAITILEHGEKALVDTLLIQVRVVFQPTHEHQPELADVQRWLSQHGFQFYRLNDLNHARLLGDDLQGNSLPGTALVSADALFLPDSDRLSCLGQAAKTKLAFLLHTVFGAKDAAFSLLQGVDEELASRYLSAETLPIENQVSQGDKKNTDEAQPITLENEGEEEPRLPEAPHMSDAERRLFEDALKESKRYFEFGSGGSTVWAVNAGLTAYGVESDANWVSALKESLGERCQVEVVDIGPTREWGYPTSLEASGRFQNYSRAILAHDSPFDLILVDGRFRVACVITAIQHLLSHGVDPDEARIFIHDFWDRPVYHIVLDFLDPVERVDTAGLFKLKKKIKEKNLRKVWQEYARQPA